MKARQNKTKTKNLIKFNLAPVLASLFSKTQYCPSNSNSNGSNSKSNVLTMWDSGFQLRSPGMDRRPTFLGCNWPVCLQLHITGRPVRTISLLEAWWVTEVISWGKWSVWPGASCMPSLEPRQLLHSSGDTNDPDKEVWAGEVCQQLLWGLVLCELSLPHP